MVTKDLFIDERLARRDIGTDERLARRDIGTDERLARRDIGTDEHWPGSGSLRPELLDGEPMAWSGLDVDDTFSAGPVRVQSLADFGGNIDVARVVTAGPPPAIWLG